MSIRIPTFHIHFAICVGDDEDIDVKDLFRGWRGKILKRLGFTVAARWALLHRLPNEVHIVPINDGMSHDTHGASCVCGPFALREKHNGDADDTWLFTHQSLDRREIAPTQAEMEG